MLGEKYLLIVMLAAFFLLAFWFYVFWTSQVDEVPPRSRPVSQILITSGKGEFK